MLARWSAFLFVLVSIIGLGCNERIQPTLEVAPSSGTIVTGRTTQLSVTRRFPGGHADDVTAKVKYTSSNRNVLGVDAKGNLIPGNEAGNAIIRVDDPQSEAFATAAFTVVPPR